MSAKYLLIASLIGLSACAEEPETEVADSNESMTVDDGSMDGDVQDAETAVADPLGPPAGSDMSGNDMATSNAMGQ